MKVVTRLVLFGAVLPASGMALTAVLGGVLFDRSLRAEVDRALLTQAALESVSLFDGPGGEPHLHLSQSKLASEVAAGAPTAVLYDLNGDIVAAFPAEPSPTVAVPDVPAAANAPQLVESRVSDGTAARALVVRVTSPAGQDFVLRLERSLGPIEAAGRHFARVSYGMTLALALVLLLVQVRQARQMSRRIDAMRTILPMMRGTDQTTELAVDPTGDEIADLRVALTDALEELRKARAAQDRLVANAAHELRTPLGVIRTELDLALRRERSVSELRAAAAAARAEVARLARLASRLLTLAEVGAAGSRTFDVVDVDGLIEDAVEMLTKEAAARGVGLEMALSGGGPVRLDAIAYRQAIDNLLTNAIRFSEPSTVVKIEVARDSEQVVLRVTNRGRGVSPANAERIFEPFLRERHDGDGSGLGLAIVKEVALRHRGRAWLERSGPPETTFVLSIPAVVAPPAQTPRVDASAGRSRPSSIS